MDLRGGIPDTPSASASPVYGHEAARWQAATEARPWALRVCCCRSAVAIRVRIRVR
ncbi:hypothetical protein [Streptomyces sp. CBMAI 2042]|uniref:hypothetical protein n=1 Tax=Streptomyces sp. CBMAI 2042 TaxID=2305222 RepID=UPI001F17B491|nr:hypothetical protein [Streptomyces sp. CBMAI 2042]